MGIDIGSVSAKGVIIDKYDNIMASAYIYTFGNPIKGVVEVLKGLKKEIDLDKYEVVAVGVTGSARKLIGSMLGAVVIKNEITALVAGIERVIPNIKTIFEIGGEDSKIVLINNGNIMDYSINSSCMAGCGSFIDSFARRLDVNISDFGKIAINSKKKINVDARCMVFTETDLVNKIQEGYKKEDIAFGLCYGIASNFVNNLTKGKKIQTPIAFLGGVSKNEVVVNLVSNMIGEKIVVDKNSHLMGAMGIAFMARDSKKTQVFDFNVEDYSIETKIANCSKCSNNCEIVTIYKNSKIIDYWGNKCSSGNIVKTSNS